MRCCSVRVFVGISFERGVQQRSTACDRNLGARSSTNISGSSLDASGRKIAPDCVAFRMSSSLINHEQPEDITLQIADRRDMSSTSSKQNSYEVGMVLKIVRYLAQQGYGTEKMVVLTPYWVSCINFRRHFGKTAIQYSTTLILTIWYVLVCYLRHRKR